MRFRLSFYFILLLLTANCASMGSGSSEQVLLVQSNPPGASVWQDGNFLGHTPRFVKIRRSSHPTLEIANDESELGHRDGKISVPLKTRYRWASSFFSNFIFYAFAPIGWATDLLTGNAWDAQPPPLVPVQLTAEDKVHASLPRAPENYAVAPPLSDQMALSDSGGEEIESKLRKTATEAHILPFHDTLPIFLSQGYDFDGALTEEERGSLYYDLNAQHIFESAIEPEQDHLRLKVFDHDIYHQTRKPAFELRLDPSTDLDWVYTSNAWWSRLLLNTVTVDFVSSSLEITRGQKQYTLRDADRTQWGEVALKYLSALNITSLPPRRAGRASRWTVNLVPVLRVSRKRVRADNLSSQVATLVDAAPDDEGTSEEYTRWLISGGYGPEFGWQISRHYFYLNMVPVVYWSEISWSTQARDRSVTNMGLQLATELGYILYLSQNWNMRLFTRTQNESSSGWSEALGSRLPASQDATSVSALMYGLSIGYRFEPGARAHQD